MMTASRGAGLPFVACDRLSHVKKLSMVRKPCQVRDFGGVGAKNILTRLNFLTSRNFFLTRPSWDPTSPNISLPLACLTVIEYCMKCIRVRLLFLPHSKL